MNDQELYDLIKQAVRERKQIPHHSQAQSFAQRYCEQQLQKKYNPYHSSTKKMGMIMKNFTKLETYFNFPQLIESLRELKNKPPINQSRSLPKHDTTTSSEPFQKRPLSRHQELKNLRQAAESESIKQLLSSLQSESEWKSENMKNNSSYHMSCIDDSIRQQRETNPSQESLRVFWMLNSFLKNQKDLTTNNQNIGFNNPPKTTAEQKKQFTKFLHKVSSYLQIVLEDEHKHKWSRKKSSDFLVPQGLASHSKSVHYKVKKKKNPVAFKDLSNTKCIEVLREQTKKLREIPVETKKVIEQGDERSEEKHEKSEEKNKKSEDKTEQKKRDRQQYIFQHTTTVNIDSSKFTRNRGVQWKPTNDTFFATSPSLLASREAKPSSSIIKQNFTFRRRSVKQKIIKKLDKFIFEIDEETHSNKKQNHYYSNQINKLEHHFKRLYGRYRKETIAGDQDIQNLKKMAQQYTIMTPQRGPRAGFEENYLKNHKNDRVNSRGSDQ